ncbi:MAG: DMT family transporter [Bacteroidetes bacterium]|nr:DMT family transporter [Bacteroidota bacterium]
MRNEFRYNILATIACIVWASAFPAAKVGFEYLPPIFLSGIRFTLAGLILAPFLIKRKVDWRDFKRQGGYILFFAFFQTFLQYYFFYTGLIRIPAEVGAVLVGLGPIFVAILAHIFIGGRDRMSLRKIIAIVLGFSGVAYLSFSKGLEIENAGADFYIGVLCVVTSCLIGCVTNIIVVKRKKHLDHVALNTFSCFLGGLMLTAISLFLEPQEIANIKPLPMDFYFAMIWLAGIPALGFSIWYYLLSRPQIIVSEINIIKFLIPVFGVILSWIIVEGENPNFTTVIGVVIISVAIIIIQLPERKKIK